MSDKLYWYRATVVSVYDADTIRCDIDVGFGVTLKRQSIRLYGINAPEVRGIERPAGLQSRDWLRSQLFGENVVLRTYRDKKGKYGRWLAEVFLADKNINKELVVRGLAQKATY